MKPKPDLEKMEEDILERGEDPSLFPILNSRPEIFRDLLWIWEGFMCLSIARQFGMSAPQPISFTDINAFCEFMDIRDRDDRDDFVYHVQKLDGVFIRENQKNQKNRPKGPNGQPQGLAG